jgi:uncharacterized protein (TIGR00369 family)
MARKIHGRGHDTKHVRMPVNRCFACGPHNPEGMHLKFHLDAKRRRSYCYFRLPKRYQGPPAHAHGGIIATVLDEAMGKVNKLRSVIALTKEMQIEYLKPVPLGKRLLAEGHERSVKGRRHINVGEIRDEKGQVLARGRGVFIAVDAAKMFAKHFRAGDRTGPLANAPSSRNSTSK